MELPLILAVNPVLLGIGVVALVLVVFGVVRYRKELLALGQQFRTFLQDVYIELKKSSWPTWIELRDSTLVVIVAVVALALFVGAADWVFVKIIAFLTGGGAQQ
jgi:preprotein translocase SecE subunit